MQSLCLQKLWYANLQNYHYPSPETSCQIRCAGSQQNLRHIVGTTTTDNESIINQIINQSNKQSIIKSIMTTLYSKMSQANQRRVWLIVSVLALSECSQCSVRQHQESWDGQKNETRPLVGIRALCSFSVALSLLVEWQERHLPHEKPKILCHFPVRFSSRTTGRRTTEYKWNQVHLWKTDKE